MVTIFEFLAFLLIIGIPISVGKLVGNYFGVWLGIGSAIFSSGFCVVFVFLLYRASGRRYEQRQRELREKYRGVYRVLALPTESGKVRKAQGSEIRVGDYGWEAEPLHNDGLIYLQGLTAEWCVVWYAAFHFEEIEWVGPKPCSQYDCQYSWARTPPYCPYTVQLRHKADMGLPMANPKIRGKSSNAS